MKQLLFLSLGIVIVLLSQVIKAGGEELPRGSYLHDCTNCYIHNKNVLVCPACRTQNTNPAYMRSSYLILEPNRGGENIANCWGHLIYGNNCDDFIPKGAYTETCGNCWIGYPDGLTSNGLKIGCVCRNRAGSDIKTQWPGGTESLQGGEVLNNCNGQLTPSSC